MSSKHAAARGGKELTLQILSLIEKGRFANMQEIEQALGKPRSRLYRRMYEVKRLKYITETPRGYALASAGRKRINEERVWGLTIPRMTRWDKKWRVVLFDIPTNRKKYRDTLRLRLKELGLLRYQDSVWIYPYPIRETIQEIVHFYFLSDYVSFMTIEEVTHEHRLRKHFRL